MDELRLVPKPEGYELRDKRSDKANDATLWDGHDALYEASQRMPQDCKAAAVLWRDARGRLCWSAAGTRDTVIALCATMIHERAT